MSRGSFSYAFLVRPSATRCPPRGWASILQKRSVARTDRFQNQMVVTGDSFLGVRFLSAESTRVIGVQRYLGCTVRSHGFSPSQRFAPTRAWWPCFMPHPPLGFWSSEPFPLHQPRYLSIPVALLPSRQRAGVASYPVFPVALTFGLPLCPSSMECLAEVPVAHLRLRQTSASPVIRLTPDVQVWRVARAPRRVDARRSLGWRFTSDG